MATATSAGEDRSTQETAYPNEAGIIWVGSTTTQPSALSHADFTQWYEDVHVGEVMDTGGVPGAIRYQRPDGPLARSTSPTTTSRSGGGTLDEFEYITMYSFPSTHFRFTPPFKALDGQSKPKGDMFERVFSKACFATRFCGLVYWHAAGENDDSVAEANGQRPVDYLALVTLDKAAEGRLGFLGVGGKLAELEGYVRTRAFATRASTVLREFVRGKGTDGVMLMIEFDKEPKLDAVVKALEGAGEIQEKGVFSVRSRMGSWK